MPSFCKSFCLLSVCVQSLLSAHTPPLPRDAPTIDIPKENYTVNYYTEFSHWIDYAGPYLRDGVTEFLDTVSTGSSVEIQSQDMNKLLIFTNLPKPQRTGGRRNELQSPLKQYLNFIAQKKNITLFDLPGRQESTQYPPAYFGGKDIIAVDVNATFTGSCIHPQYGPGSWQLSVWNHEQGSSFLFVVAFATSDPEQWFEEANEMVK